MRVGTGSEYMGVGRCSSSGLVLVVARSEALSLVNCVSARTKENQHTMTVSSVILATSNTNCGQRNSQKHSSFDSRKVSPGGWSCTSTEAEQVSLSAVSRCVQLKWFKSVVSMLFQCYELVRTLLHLVGGLT